MRRASFLLLLAATASCALVRDLFPARPEGVSGTATRIGGAEAMAAGIAMQDYMSAQAAGTDAAGLFAPDGGILAADSDAGLAPETVFLHRCINAASNYEVWVELDGGAHRWKVTVWPSGKCMEDMYGGGAEYEIDADTFQIINRSMEE